MIVRFPFTLDDAVEMKPVTVARPPVERVVPTAREPVRLAVDEIVCPLIVPEVIAPKFVAPATDRVPLISVLPVVRNVEKRFVEEAVVANDAVDVALVVVEFPTIVRFPFTVDEAFEMKPVENVERPPVERVVPTASEPVKFAVAEIV